MYWIGAHDQKSVEKQRDSEQARPVLSALGSRIILNIRLAGGTERRSWQRSARMGDELSQLDVRKLSTGRANWTATHVDHSVGGLATDTSSVITEKLARARRRDDESAAAKQNTTPAGFASQFLPSVRWRSDGLVRTQTRDDQWSASHLVSRKNGGLGTRRRIPALFLGWKSDFDDTHDFAAPPTTRRNNRADAFAKKDFHQLLRLRE